MGVNIIKLTAISALVVAALGTNKNSGARNKARKKNRAVTAEVNPERPPTATPAVLSITVVTVEVPNIAPIVVPMESANNAYFIRGIFPLESVNPAFMEVPNKVPKVSNISMRVRVVMIIIMSKEKIEEKSNFMKTGDMEAGMSIKEKFSGISVTPIGIPIKVHRIIE